VIVVVGLNHETAPVAVREALAFPKEGLPEALARVREEAGLGEAVILSTCNRVEVYGRSTGSSGDAVAAFLARFHSRNLEDIAPHLYRLEGEAATGLEQMGYLADLDLGRLGGRAPTFAPDAVPWVERGESGTDR